MTKRQAQPVKMWPNLEQVMEQKMSFTLQDVSSTNSEPEAEFEWEGVGVKRPRIEPSEFDVSESPSTKDNDYDDEENNEDRIAAENSTAYLPGDMPIKTEIDSDEDAERQPDEEEYDDEEDGNGDQHPEDHGDDQNNRVPSPLFVAQIPSRINKIIDMKGKTQEKGNEPSDGSGTDGFDMQIKIININGNVKRKSSKYDDGSSGIEYDIRVPIKKEMQSDKDAEMQPDEDDDDDEAQNDDRSSMVPSTVYAVQVPERINKIISKGKGNLDHTIPIVQKKTIVETAESEWDGSKLAEYKKRSIPIELRKRNAPPDDSNGDEHGDRRDRSVVAKQLKQEPDGPIKKELVDDNAESSNRDPKIWPRYLRPSKFAENLTPEQCEVCNQEFANIYLLQIHLDNTHFWCEKCKCMLSTKIQSRKHEIGVFECKACAQVFCTKEILWEHYNNVHAALAESQWDGKKLAEYKKRSIPIELRKRNAPSGDNSGDEHEDRRDKSVVAPQLKQEPGRPIKKELVDDNTESSNRDPKIWPRFLRPSKFAENLTPEQCEVCNQEFANIYLLQIHLDNTHFWCEKCKCMLSTKIQSRKHETGVFECKACVKVFCTKGMQWEHYNNVHAAPKKKCENCGMKFITKEIKAKHICETFECQECKLSFFLKKEYTKHLYSAHRKKCNKCKCAFATVEELEKHVQRQHMPVECDICSKTIKSRKHLSTHKKIHLDLPKPTYTCDACGKQYKGLETLEQHKVTDHGAEGKYKCEICGKQYYSKTKYDEHMRIHSGEKPYQCSTCGKAFQRQSSLFIHASTHVTERNFHCNICGYSYRTKYDLKAHMGRHDPSKHVSCKVCFKTFNCKNTLRVHMEIHENERRHKCDICGVAYNSAGSLWNHKKMHKERIEML